MFGYIIALGRFASDGLRGLGEIAILLLRCLRWLARGIRYKRETVQQFYFIGVQSLPVILTTGAFVGGVMSYTFYNQFITLSVGSWTGAIVYKAMVWQLAPVLVALMLAGRVGCAITAEIGTMNVTEQIDALDTMGTDPVNYLVLPRVLAGFFMTPALTMFAILIGIGAGLFMTVAVQGAEFHFQWTPITDWIDAYDFVHALSKSFVFGATISLICCRNGLKTTGGAEGVGKATTSANVSSCIAVLMLNFILSILLYYFRPVYDVMRLWLDYVWAGGINYLTSWFAA
ncbi:MAG: ABC transporter permease [Planctomycetota bacterium]|jgi:phospholipid/cholesterol/gamma-HCH transport system permease protein|nr:ABC transporter permease [Planctomycetota bacterium]